MTTREEKIERVREQAEREFLDPFLPEKGFGQLDTRGLPSLNQLPDESEWVDERFGGLTEQASPLGPKLVALIRAAQGGDQEAVAACKEAGIKIQPASEIVYYVAKRRGVLTQSNGKWFLQIGDDVYESEINQDREEFLLQVHAELDESRPVLFEITPQQKLKIARLVDVGDVLGATIEYARARLGEQRFPQFENDGSAETVLHDPRYIDLTNEIAWEIFKLRNSNYSRTRDTKFDEMVGEAAQNRPLTGAILDTLWLQYLDYREQHKYDHTQLFNPTEEPEPVTVTTLDLDQLSDDEINRLHAATRSVLAKSRK